MDWLGKPHCTNDSSAVGLLPEEIVQFIVRETSLQAVWSFCMASRFWYKKLRHLLAHPKILVVQISPDGLEHYRAVFKLNGGFARFVYLSGSKSDGDQAELKNGWFNSLSDLNTFLTDFNNILCENDDQKLRGRGLRIFSVKIQPVNGPATIYSTDEYENRKRIHNDTADRLNLLLMSANFVMASNEDDNRFNFDGISLKIQYNGLWPDRTFCDVFINSDGDINASIKTRNEQRINFQTRTSPALFKQLEEIVIYSKHKTQLQELNNEDAAEHFYSVFDLRYKLNGKKFFVQEYCAEEKAVRKNNGFKNGAIKKILRILEPLFVGKDGSSFISKKCARSAPPEFPGHKLIRIPSFKSPILHEDLPSIVAIELRCSKDGLHTLHLFGGLPMAKVVKLFRQVESEINYEDTRPHSPNVMAGQMLPRRITAVKIHSLKSFRPITKMPTHLIRLVWYHICLEMGLKDPCATDDE